MQADKEMLLAQLRAVAARPIHDPNTDRLAVETHYRAVDLIAQADKHPSSNWMEAARTFLQGVGK